MKRTDLWFYRLGMIVVGAGLVISISILYDLFWPFKVIDFQDASFPTTQKIYHPGDTVEYVIRYCKYLELPVHLNRVLVDTYIIVGTEETSNLPVGCGTKLSRFVLPRDLPKDTYHIEITINVYPNQFRTITYKHPTVNFTVQ